VVLFRPFLVAMFSYVLLSSLQLVKILGGGAVKFAAAGNRYSYQVCLVYLCRSVVVDGSITYYGLVIV
jgi:hypothetical protein